MILNDIWIRKHAEKGMIVPFVNHQVKEEIRYYISEDEDFGDIKHEYPTKVISYGLSSFGYDIRLGNEFKIFTNVNSSIIDPKYFDEKVFVDMRGDTCIIPPNSFVLARSVERFKIPRDVMTVCLGKSTYARCGLIVNVTPLEPEWEGYITIEISNTTPLPAKIYANEGIAQILFFKGEQPKVSYKDKGGKYQDQVGVVSPKV